MTKIFDIVPGFAWAIVFGLLLAFCTAQSVRLAGSKSSLADAEIALSKARVTAAERAGAIATLTAKAQESARENENKMAAAAKGNVHAIEIEKAASAAALSAARLDAAGLRQRINAFATGGGAGQAAPGTSAGLSLADRASRLGDVLETCSSEAIEDAGELEQLAGQVRGLLGHVKVVEAGQADYWGSKTFHP